MAKVVRHAEFKHVEFEPGLDFAELIEATHADGVPRVIERGGEPLAVIAPPDDYPEADRIPKSRRHYKEIMALAGSLSDADAGAILAYIRTSREASRAPALSEP